MTIRMGYWDCPSCNHKRNLGPNPTCANCGLARGPKIPFYTDDSAPVIDDPEEVARARAGADWKCKYCGADNPAGKMDCHQCGAGPDGSVKREEKFIPVAAAAAPPKKSVNLGLILGIIGGVLAVLGLAIWFFFIRTTSMEVTVESVSWVKTVEVLELRNEEHQAWADEVPAGARVIRSETRGRDKQVQEGTKKTKTGTKDLGNGRFEDVYKEEPNYVTKKVDDTWVTYETEEWRRAELLESVSKDGKEPPEPEVKGTLGRSRKIGEKTSKAVYQLKAKNGKSYTYEVDAAKEGAGAVTKYEVGKKYTAQITALGAVKKLGP